MDGSTIYEKPLFDAAFNVAEAKKVNVQVKRGTTGGNDSGAIHLARDGVRTLTLSVPCRYLHSADCVIDKRDVMSVKEIAFGIFELMARDEI